VNENIIGFFQRRQDIFSLARPIDIQRFLADAIDHPADVLPVPAKIDLSDEARDSSYGFAITRAEVLDELVLRLERWISEEIAARTGDESKTRAGDALEKYRSHLVKTARNAVHSSILGDYHGVFWLVHSSQLARVFSALPRQILATTTFSREEADDLKYVLFSRWANAMRESVADIVKGAPANAAGFMSLIIENPLIATEEFIASDLRALRAYFTSFLKIDFAAASDWFQGMRVQAAELIASDKVFARAFRQLGYHSSTPTLTMVLDPRVQDLLFDHPAMAAVQDRSLYESTARRLLQFYIVYYLRRSLVWMKKTEDGDTVSDEGSRQVVYSRSIRPMNFGRRGVVEPIVFRFGLVYDITAFAQTLGEIARGGAEEEQVSYQQMVEFQRDLADITQQHSLQFEKFLGDGAFYTSRRAAATLHAALHIQRFYAAARRDGFAFNRGLRIGINYGYYRLLPMRIAADGSEIKEFYGPGIVELSRLTTGKTTKDVEDFQQFLLSHGYDNSDVYRFFAPLSQSITRNAPDTSREFYAYINENGHLINEGIVVSIPFLEQLSQDLASGGARIYRLRTKSGVYLGFPSDTQGYVAVRILGAVSLKGMEETEVGEVHHFTHEDADVSVVDDPRPFLQLLQQERNRSAAKNVAQTTKSGGTADLIVCESRLDSATPVIFVGEWDPVSEEIRRPIQLGGEDAERYGLAVPLTEESVQTQSMAYQKLYTKLSRIETLPSFSVQVIRRNASFNGFIIGPKVERI
jgi:hypothetical protein